MVKATHVFAASIIRCMSSTGLIQPIAFVSSSSAGQKVLGAQLANAAASPMTSSTLGASLCASAASNDSTAVVDGLLSAIISATGTQGQVSVDGSVILPSSSSPPVKGSSLGSAGGMESMVVRNDHSNLPVKMSRPRQPVIAPELISAISGVLEPSEHAMALVKSLLSSSC